MSSSPEQPDGTQSESPRPVVPPMPTRPEPPGDSAQGQQRGCTSIVLASVAGMILLSLLIVLTMSFGFVPLVAVAILGGVFLITYLHYITWGWWLGRQILREEEEDEDD